MPRNWSGQLKKGPVSAPRDIASKAIADTVTDFRNVKLLREVERMGEPQDTTINAILTPILSTVGQQLAEKIRETGKPPTADDIDSSLTKALNRLTMAKTISVLGGEDHGPQPNSTQDLAAMANTAVAIHQGAAQSMHDMAEVERERRMEAEDSLNGVAAQVRAEEQEKSALQFDWMNKTFSEIRQLTETIHNDRLVNERERAADAVARIEQTARESLERVSKAMEEQMKLQAQNFEKDKLLIQKDHEIELIKLTAGPRAETPQDIVNKKYAEVQGRKLERQEVHEAKREALEIQGEQKKLEFMDTLVDAVPTVLAAIGGGGSAPRNGIPGTPPPPPPND